MACYIRANDTNKDKRSSTERTKNEYQTLGDGSDYWNGYSGYNPML